MAYGVSQGSMHLRHFLVVAIGVAVSTVAFAHRSPPPIVAPVAYGNVKLVARYSISSHSCVGLIEALATSDPTPPADTIDDPHDHKFLWRAEVFRVPVRAPLEQDAQWVFIRSMELRGGDLIVVSERGTQFAVNLTTHRVH